MEKETLDRYIVILAGGGGTRLWPQSRAKTPKQFLKLFGKQTLLQITYERTVGLVDPSHVLVVTSGEFKKEVARELPSLPAENILAEPVAAGTAAAVALAVAYLSKRHENAIISTLASDHFIREKEKFLDYLSASQEFSLRGDYIVTMGLTPTYPHTGLGYIFSGKKVLQAGTHLAMQAAGFTEKPQKETAHSYVASGDYLWNANINSYQMAAIRKSFREHMPLLSQALEKASKVIGGRKESKKLREIWSLLPNESFDTGILEKANNVLVVPASFGWLDIGDWSVLHEHLAKKLKNNIVLEDSKGEIIFIDSTDTLVSSPRLVGLVGVEDLVVIDTEDALLICKKSKAQDVKKIVEEIKKRSLKSYL